MQHTLESLMQAVGCPRWQDIFDGAMATYDQEPDLDALATESSLQAGIVAHYKAGKYIYELPGYFIYDPENRKQ